MWGVAQARVLPDSSDKTGREMRAVDRLTELMQTLDDAAKTARTHFVDEPKAAWFEDSFEWLQSQTGFAALVGDEQVAVAIIAARLGAERACEVDRAQFARLEEALLQWAADHPSRGPRVLRG